jgi:hypothetical protein
VRVDVHEKIISLFLKKRYKKKESNLLFTSV